MYSFGWQLSARPVLNKIIWQITRPALWYSRQRSLCSIFGRRNSTLYNSAPQHQLSSHLCLFVWECSLLTEITTISWQLDSFNPNMVTSGFLKQACTNYEASKCIIQRLLGNFIDALSIIYLQSVLLAKLWELLIKTTLDSASLLLRFSVTHITSVKWIGWMVVERQRREKT